MPKRKPFAPIEGETQSYTMRFMKEHMDRLKEMADEENSVPSLIRKAVAEFLKPAVSLAEPVPVPGGFTPEPSLANAEDGFRLGDEAACERLEKNQRLSIKMATGGTIGQDIARRIKLDLIGADDAGQELPD